MSSKDNIENILVSDFMTRNVKTIAENETMSQAAKLMYQDNIGCVIILRERDATGIVTERDIAKMVGFSAQFFGDIPVSKVMSKPLITISPDNSVKDAVALMQQKDIRRLLVLDDKGQMAGVITDKDILRAVFKSFKKTVKDHGLATEGFELLGFLGAE
jgi:CBS domain-containing protein